MTDLIAQARTLLGRVHLFDDTPEIAEWQDGSYRGQETSDHLLALHDEFKQAAAILTALVERDEALIAAGNRLSNYAVHDDDCQIVTHGVWSDPIPCSCGYTEAVKAWKEVRGE